MEKRSQIMFGFCDNCIIKCDYKLSLIRREYLLSELKRSTNIAKMLPITKRDFLIFYCTHRDQWMWQRWWIWALKSVSSHLACCLLKGRLKRDFLDIYPSTFFGDRKLKNTCAMSVKFFWRCLKFNINLENAKKIQKVLLFLR